MPQYFFEVSQQTIYDNEKKHKPRSSATTKAVVACVSLRKRRLRMGTPHSERKECDCRMTESPPKEIIAAVMAQAMGV